MARVANYEHFSDVSFDLQIGADIDMDLTAVIENTPQGGEGCLLTWNVRLEGSGDSVTYRVLVNGDLQNTFTATTKDWHSLQETVSTTVVKKGENTVRFVVTGGTGRLSIGDVVLFYRHDIGPGGLAIG